MSVLQAAAEVSTLFLEMEDIVSTSRQANIKTKSTPDPTGHTLTTNEAQLKHMFRNADGHFAQDTPANRAIIEHATSSNKNFLSTDQHGTLWYAENLQNGTQAWAKVRDGIITEGGVNQTPRTFNPTTGLSSQIKP